MRGSRFRLLLIILATVCLGNLALTARNRGRTTLQPRRIESAPSQSELQFDTSLARRDSTPGSGLFQRYSQQQREQETTIRKQPTTHITPSQVRSTSVLKRDQLIDLVEEAVTKTSRRYLDVDQYTPWQIMHGVLALRGDYRLRSRGRLISGIDFISSGPKFRGEYWWQKTSFGGRGHPYSVPYHFEGHINQFPALLSMAALPMDHKLVARGGTITVGDIVRNAQRTVNTNEEISWTLWLLTQYIKQDAQWVNAQGQKWSMESLVRLQVADGVDNAPCGGTHGLFALAFSRNAYIRQNGQLRGVWVNSEYKLRKHIELARQLQNPDGSFSTNWFKGRGFTYDFKERIKTSGHMLEWLMMALPASRLDEPWVRRGIQAVANDLIRNATAPAECGPMYHAVHALVLYMERVAPGKSLSPEKPAELASTTKPRNSGKAPTTSVPKSVASKASRPTDPSMIPPEPARPEPGALTLTPKPADTTVPKIHEAAPTKPGIVRISPAAPGTIARNATAGNRPATAKATPPASADARDDSAKAASQPPAMLTQTDAKPLVKSHPGDLPGDATPPMAPQAPRPLLVLQKPVAAPDQQDAATMESDPSQFSDEPETPPSDLPSALAATALPPDLPPAMAADESPEDLPSAIAVEDAPILPQLANDEPSGEDAEHEPLRVTETSDESDTETR